MPIPAPAASTSPPGTLARLSGLQSAAGRKLNGTHVFAVHTAADTEAAGRVAVIALPFSRGARPITVKRGALAPVLPAAASARTRAAFATGMRAHSIALLRSDLHAEAATLLEALLASGALDRHDDGETIASTDVPARGAVLALRACALRGAGNADDAARDLQDVLADAAVVPRVRARAQCELALCRVAQGDLFGAACVIDDMLAALEAGTGDGTKPDQEDEDCADDDDEHGLDLGSAVVQAAHAILQKSSRHDDEEHDALTRRAAEAVLVMRAQDVDAMRALGHVLCRCGKDARGGALLRDADAVEEASRIVPGALVQLCGLRNARTLNGRYAAVGSMAPAHESGSDGDEIGVAVLPVEGDESVMRVSMRHVRVVAGASAAVKADAALGEQYASGVAQLGGMLLRGGAEGDVRTAHAMCGRAADVTRGLRGVDSFGTLLFVQWLALRADGADDAAQRVRDEVGALEHKDAAPIAAEMARVIKAQNEGVSSCGGCCGGDHGGCGADG